MPAKPSHGGLSLRFPGASLEDLGAKTPRKLAASPLKGLLHVTQQAQCPHHSNTTTPSGHHLIPWETQRGTRTTTPLTLRSVKHELPHGVCPARAWPWQQGLPSTVHHAPTLDAAHSPSAIELPPQRGQPRTSCSFQ